MMRQAKKLDEDIVLSNSKSRQAVRHEPPPINEKTAPGERAVFDKNEFSEALLHGERNDATPYRQATCTRRAEKGRSQ